MSQKPSAIRLGSVAPDFEADTTQGRIRLYDYIGNNWAIFFCAPDDFTPVATTELVLFASLQKQLAARNVKFLFMTTENEPTADSEASGYVSHKDWAKDVNEIGLAPVNFPFVKDVDGSISLSYHVLDENDVTNLNADNELTTGNSFNSRSLFIIGPEYQSKHHVRMIFQYPATVGFNTGEVLRAIDALQLSDSARVRTPANWIFGGDVVVHPEMSDDEANSIFPNFKAVKPYLRFVEMPAKNVTDQQLFFRGGRLVSFGMRVENGVMGVQSGTESHAIEAMA